MWIGLGVLAPIARILSAQAGNGKKRSRDVNGGGAQLKRKTGRVDEEEARLQAIIIVGSLAHGEWGREKSHYVPTVVANSPLT